jgi:hypothetical protein
MMAAVRATAITFANFGSAQTRHAWLRSRESAKRRGKPRLATGESKLSHSQMAARLRFITPPQT